ncbi:hypothetical protein D8674_023145 [Pyrus ussuriensis x Pyrus communis]|uniref:Uncharacterized protein n=1 Tax=Pyrus ussuriensis x Pyrus communis TaxID=2448454 RepID=A0A5N5GN51_9ROSA|nr:hypothetical protein D8674_023145 [Pyrus ussuriensis x Pyrus communis]
MRFGYIDPVLVVNEGRSIPSSGRRYLTILPFNPLTKLNVKTRGREWYLFHDDWWLENASKATRFVEGPLCPTEKKREKDRVHTVMVVPSSGCKDFGAGCLGCRRKKEKGREAPARKIAARNHEAEQTAMPDNSIGKCWVRVEFREKHCGLSTDISGGVNTVLFGRNNLSPGTRGPTRAILNNSSDYGHSWHPNTFGTQFINDILAITVNGLSLCKSWCDPVCIPPWAFSNVDELLEAEEDLQASPTKFSLSDCFLLGTQLLAIMEPSPVMDPILVDHDPITKFEVPKNTHLSRKQK